MTEEPMVAAQAFPGGLGRAGREALNAGVSDAFWLQAARRLDWMTPPTEAGDWSFDRQDFHIRWFGDGVLNVSVNCIDRHLAERGEQVAIVFEPDEPSDTIVNITYAGVCTRRYVVSPT